MTSRAAGGHRRPREREQAGGPGLDQVAQQLLDEERVAVGFPVHGREQLGGQATADEALREGCGVGVGDTPERDAPQQVTAVQPVQHLAERAAVRHAVRAARRHHQQPGLAARLHDVPEQGGGGDVGQVQVVEDQQHRHAVGHGREERGHRVEHLVAAHAEVAVCAGQAVGKAGQHRRQVGRAVAEHACELVRRRDPHEVADGLHERDERGDGLFLRRALQHDGGRRVAGAQRELAGQATLPDPGLAVDDRHQRPRAVDDVAPRLPEHGELGGPAHERGRVAQPQPRGDRDPQAGPPGRLVLGARRALRGRLGHRAEPADRLLRGVRRRDPQLPPQRLPVALEAHQRIHGVARGGEPGDERGVGGLVERVELGAPSGQPDRGTAVARVLGARRQRFEGGTELPAVGLARVVDPLLLDARQQLSPVQGDGLRVATAPHVLGEGGGVHPHGGMQADAVARRVEQLRACRPPERPQRVAQACPRPGVEVVGPEPPREGCPRVRTRVQGEPREHEARPPGVGQLDGPTVHLDGQLAEHEHPEHGSQPSRLDAALTPRGTHGRHARTMRNLCDAATGLEGWR
jgi:hypothetical protein